MKNEVLRTCRKCGKEAFSERDLKEFSTNAKMKYGVGTICKCCDKKKQDKYREDNGIIPTGFKKGFDVNKTARLYYVKIKKNNQYFYKLGITNRTIKKRLSGEMLDGFKVLMELQTNGINAKLLESKLLELHLHDTLAIKKPNMDTVMRNTGNRELFDKDILGLDK